MGELGGLADLFEVKIKPPEEKKNVMELINTSYQNIEQYLKTFLINFIQLETECQIWATKYSSLEAKCTEQEELLKKFRQQKSELRPGYDLRKSIKIEDTDETQDNLIKEKEFVFREKKYMENIMRLK